MCRFHQITLGLTNLITLSRLIMEEGGHGKISFANVQPWIEDISWKSCCVSGGIIEVYTKLG
jgi:hypothetical protein